MPTATMRDMEKDGHEAKFFEAWKWIVNSFPFDKTGNTQRRAMMTWKLAVQKDVLSQRQRGNKALWLLTAVRKKIWTLRRVAARPRSKATAHTAGVGDTGEWTARRDWPQKETKEVMARSRMAKARLSPKVVGHRKWAGMEAGMEVGSAKEMEEKAKVTEGMELRFCRGTTLMATCTTHGVGVTQLVNKGGRLYW